MLTKLDTFQSIVVRRKSIKFSQINNSEKILEVLGINIGDKLSFDEQKKCFVIVFGDPFWEVNWSIFIRHDKYKVGNKNKNKLKSAKRFPNNHRQCSTDKS